MVTFTNSRFSRIIPLLITIFSLSLPAYAKYSGGTGEPNDPYQIATAADLIALGETPKDYDKHFILTAGIDLDPNLPGRKVFDKAVIAPDTNDVKFAFQGTDFSGIFDGNGHVISNLHIQGSGYLGLFGRLDYTAKIFTLDLEAVNIHGIGFSIGSLTGLNSGGVSNCYSTGTVSGDQWVGGLVGSNGGKINMCYSTANVSGNKDIGGLVGFHSSRGSISSSFSTGTVMGDEYIGGLVGFNGGPVTHCYSKSTVNGQSTVGGLAGLNNIDGKIHNCFSTGRISGTSDIGGLIGRGEGIVTNNVWDIETSGQVGSEDGVGLTTAEMMDSYMLGLNGFANDPNWVLNPGLDYPRLGWEGTPGQVIPEPEIDWLEGNGIAENPYQIDTANQLILLGKASILWDNSFVLCADMNLNPNLPDGQVFGQAVIPKFAGVFDGNDHVISDLTITGGSYIGLFGRLEEEAEVKDLRVVNVNITGSGDYVGSLTGLSNGDISNCYSSGTVNGRDSVGGLVGSNNWYGNITMSYSTGAVAGDWLVGGLVGNNGGNIITCYSTVVVNGGGYVGGLVGGNGGGTTSGSITDCYSTGSVIGDRLVGGLVGINSYGLDGGDITNCYSTGVVIGSEDVGGLVGRNSSLGRITSCFWDMETSGQIISDGGGEGKTTDEIMESNTFVTSGWDFIGETEKGPNDIWKIWDGYDYPRLTWEAGPKTPLVFVDINDPGFFGQMSRYEVTNAQYCDFLNAALASGDITIDSNDVVGASGSNSGEDYAGQRYYRCDGSGWTMDGATNGGASRIHYNEGAFSVASGFGNHPVTFVSWYGAMAFANYYSYYLPTEEQWQGVADYNGTYLYGCGTSIDNSKANTSGSTHPFGTTVVGSFGQYGYGMSDMAGNVWEWTSTSSGSSRVLRGGCWFFNGYACAVSLRHAYGPGLTDGHIGFRVCR